MKKTISPKISRKSLLTVENVLGLLVAILIVFQIKPDASFATLLNSPVGIVMSLLVVVFLFVTMNPVVGFLVLIYLYEIIRTASNYTSQARNTNLQKMNPPQELQVEEIVIMERAPIKNQNQNNVVSFTPFMESLKA
jgi:hypothetical protein